MQLASNHHPIRCITQALECGKYAEHDVAALELFDSLAPHSRGYYLCYEYHLYFNKVKLEPHFSRRDQRHSRLCDYDIPDGATIDILTADVKSKFHEASRAVHLSFIANKGCGCHNAAKGHTWTADASHCTQHTLLCPSGAWAVDEAFIDAKAQMRELNVRGICGCRKCIADDATPWAPGHVVGCNCVLCRTYDDCGHAFYLVQNKGRRVSYECRSWDWSIYVPWDDDDTWDERIELRQIHLISHPDSE